MSVAFRIKDFEKGQSGLRIPDFVLHRRDCVVISGLSGEQIKQFTQLITGTRVPRYGSLEILGKSTSQLTNDEEWFELIEKIGIYSEGLREDVSVAENLAGTLRTKGKYRTEPALSSAVWKISRMVHISILELAEMMGNASPELKAKVRLGRAVALRPEILILIDREAKEKEMVRHEMAKLVRRVKMRIGCAVLAFSSHPIWISTLADRFLHWNQGEQRWIETTIREWYHRLLPFLPPHSSNIPVGIADS